MNDTQINSVLRQMRQVANQLELRPPAAERTPAGDQGFAGLLKASLEQVNATQSQATDLATRFELQDPNVSLPEVMVAMEKASVSFEAVKQVRNRVVAAYQEIMNMPI